MVSFKKIYVFPTFSDIDLVNLNIGDPKWKIGALHQGVKYVMVQPKFRTVKSDVVILCASLTIGN